MQMSDLIIGGSLAAFMLAAAGTAAIAASGPLDNSAWVLTSLGGRAAGMKAPTLRFKAGRIEGQDGCNRYVARADVTPTRISVDPRGASTRMACAPEIMAQADAFMAALSSARSWRAGSGALELLAADGSVVAAFAAQSQDLAGTSWLVTGINNGRQAVVSIVNGSRVTLAFAAAGKALGSGGCNRFAAPYHLAGEGLSFKPAVATRKTCPGDKVMEQEASFFRALEAVTTMQIEGDRLDLRDSGGALQLTLTRAPKS